jgi:hypothetical protein
VPIVFDTLEYAGRLKRAGFTEEQAAAQVQALAAVVGDNLVTKQELREQLRVLEHRLTRRLGTMLSVAVGVMAALVKLL